MHYHPHLLDPRDITGSLEFLRTHVVLGLEVTIPELAQACSLGNIDPQHLGGNAGQAAIEAAATADLPPDGAWLATVRADADALGAMAVLLIRRLGGEIAGPVAERVAAIGAADKEATGPWPGPRPIEEALSSSPVAVVAATAMDHRTPVGDRVMAIYGWLLGGHLQGEREVISRLKQEAAEALANLNAQVNDGIALVVGSHRLAMGIGYRLAPVIVATNPAFSWQGGPAHVKHTVARWNSCHPMDWDGMMEELRGAEPGWGGSSSICGSPQGTGSLLATEQVADIVRRHL